jgi:hypothetical protein
MAWTRPLSERELSAWLRYHATRDAYCPACGVKFVSDRQWAWIPCDRLIYLVDEQCALNWAGGRGVIEPDQVPAFLAAYQWRKYGHGLEALHRVAVH